MSSTKTTESAGSVFVLGCGAVGSALVRSLAAARVEIVGAHCRTAESADRATRRAGRPVSHGPLPETIGDAAVIILAVPDPTIGSVAGELAGAGVVQAGQVAFHCSGARSADELAPLRPLAAGVASFHPLLSFADPIAAAELLPEAAFAIDGDARAVARATDLVERLGGSVLRVSQKDRVLYHAAAATASNHLVALAAQAAACLGAIGIDGDDGLRALVPLMRSTLNNLEGLGLPDALTGPVSRGDAATVSAHLDAIEGRCAAELVPYLQLAQRALVVAREQGVAESDDLAQVAEVLDGRLRAVLGGSSAERA